MLVALSIGRLEPKWDAAQEGVSEPYEAPAKP